AISALGRNTPLTTDLRTLSLHDALPIYLDTRHRPDAVQRRYVLVHVEAHGTALNWLSERILTIVEAPSIEINEPAVRRDDGEERSEEHTSEPSHVKISYAVFCLKKKTKE